MIIVRRDEIIIVLVAIDVARRRIITITVIEINKRSIRVLKIILLKRVKIMSGRSSTTYFLCLWMFYQARSNKETW